MTRLDQLVEEFTHETRSTRRHLERIPNDKLAWRPHEKSFTLEQLGGHIAECVRWAIHVFAMDELEMIPANYKIIRANSVTELLTNYDFHVAAALQAMRESHDREVARPWRMKVEGIVRFEKYREAAYRDLSLSHLIHHRGQLTVYLRLLDVPLVGTYGPTADSQGAI